MAAQRLGRFKDQGGIDIQHAIAKSLCGPCMAIVLFIGMQHHDLPWQADFRGASIGKCLHTSDRQADGVGVVPMLVIGIPLEPCFQELHPMLRRAAPHPISGYLVAQSFKTNAAGPARIMAHDNCPLCGLNEEVCAPWLSNKLSDFSSLRSLPPSPLDQATSLSPRREPQLALF